MLIYGGRALRVEGAASPGLPGTRMLLGYKN